MEETYNQILRSPVGRNAAYWLRWADDWWSDQDFWSLYAMCVAAALRVSEGIDVQDDIFDDRRDILNSARILSEVIDYHPTSRHLALPASPQIHFGLLKSDSLADAKIANRPTSTKPQDVLWTSSLIDPTRSSWDAALQSSYVPVDVAQLRRYQLIFDPASTRIFNIDSLGDLASLARRYAVRNAGGVALDWPTISKDYDGVHLSFRGLMTAQEVPIQCEGGVFTLRGWDCESTAWLHIEHFDQIIKYPTSEKIDS
jgi:hypothetical protein